MIEPPSYVRRHVVEHAAAGGVLDDRFLSADFLPYVDAGRFRALTGELWPGRGSELLRMWRQLAYAWRWDAPAANADALRFWVTAGGGPPDQVVHPHSGWRPRWVHWPTGAGEILVRQPVGVTAMAIGTVPDGRLVAVVGGRDGTVRVWDLTTGTQLGDPMTGHTGDVAAVATAALPDGQAVAITGGYDATVRVWDLATGAAVSHPLTVPGYVGGLRTVEGQMAAALSSRVPVWRVWNCRFVPSGRATVSGPAFEVTKEVSMGELVGVHGMAKHQLGRHQLLGAWTPALADGLERALGHAVEPPDLDLAFYGDVYLREPAGSATKSADGESAPEGMDADELAEVIEAAAEAVTEAELRAAEQEESKGYTRTPLPVQAVLRAVDRRFGAAAGILYVGVLRQVRRYLSDPDVKALVDARVEQAMAGGCRGLIGHSLGSVVAYEYLRQHPESGVQLFLTAGSPLGLRMVRRRLPVGPVDVPTWVNVRDLRDPVTCTGALRAWWPQINEADEVVVDNGGDAHGVERYLNRKATGQALLRTLPHLVGS